MNERVRELRTAALDAVAASERREAMAELADVFGDVDAESRRTVLETYRRVVEEATSSSERELARETLERLFDRAPGEVAPVAVRVYADLATEARHSRERVEAIDALGRLARAGLPEALAADVEQTLVDVAASASRRREREHARDRLAELLAAGDLEPSAAVRGVGVDEQDVAAAGVADVDPADESMSAYLAVSLAEHLEAAARESPADCLERARELAAFVEDQPPTGADHDEVVEALSGLVDQLEVHPGDELDEQRRQRVASLADRVERLYLRGDG
jgi:hypothetical protein